MRKRRHPGHRVSPYLYSDGLALRATLLRGQTAGSRVFSRFLVGTGASMGKKNSLHSVRVVLKEGVDPLLVEPIYRSIPWISWEAFYQDGRLEIYYVGSKEVVSKLKQAVETASEGKARLIESEPLMLPEDYSYYAEARLAEPYWYVLVPHSKEDKTAYTDIILSALCSLEEDVVVQVIAKREKGARSDIYRWALRERLKMQPSLEADYITGRTYRRRQPILQIERDDVKQAELKSKHPLFLVRLRVFAKDKEVLKHITESFNVFVYNRFSWKIGRVTESIRKQFELRARPSRGFLFHSKRDAILSSRELAALAGLPSNPESLPIEYGVAMYPPPPELSVVAEVEDSVVGMDHAVKLAEGKVVALGWSKKKVYGLPEEELFKTHIACFGTTGAGKSTLARWIMLMLALKGYSVVFIDPNGDDSLKLLKMLPEELVDKVIYVDFSTLEHYGLTVRINPLEYTDIQEKELVKNTFISTLEAIYERSWGPQMARILSKTIDLLLAQPPGTVSVLDVYRVLVDEGFRKKLLENVRDDELREFWEKEWKLIQEKRKESILATINKLDQLFSPTLRPLLSARKSTFDLEEALNSGKIVIFNLSALKVSPQLKVFLGTLIFTKILATAFKRQKLGEKQRHPAFIVVDEAHNFIQPSMVQALTSLLAEARKFRVYLFLLTQFPQQLPKKLRAAVYELCKHLFVFQVGLDTAKELKKLFEPVLDEKDLVEMPLHWFAVKSRIKGKTLPVFHLKGLYIPVELEGDHVLVDDPVIRERVERILKKYGARIEEEELRIEKAKPILQPPLSPAAYLLGYIIFKHKGTVGLREALRELRDILHVDPIDAMDYVEELLESKLAVKARRGKATQLKLTEPGFLEYETSFKETKHTGGERHREAILRITDYLRSKGYYVKVDVEGYSSEPDIVAIPPSGPDEWDHNSIIVYEVEADPIKNTTRRKLEEIINRSSKYRPSKVYIVVPDIESRITVEDRLTSINTRGLNITIITLDEVVGETGLARTSSVSVKEARATREARSAKSTSKDNVSERMEGVEEETNKEEEQVTVEEEKKISVESVEDLLELLKPRLEEFVEAGLVGFSRDGSKLYISQAAVDELGLDLTLRELARKLNLQVKSARIKGEVVKALIIPNRLHKVTSEQVKQ